ncbi:MAG: DUF2236 domain-containing protein [Ketobacter sp.]|nr:MAG: DUF2236 domain-containing protein [Ketobacter sp.]
MQTLPNSIDNSAPSYLSDEEIRPFLSGIAGFVKDPKVGLFGPDSMFWEVNRHTLVYFLGAVQSVQMQLCHPWIATAVFEHSKIMTDPKQRAQLTYTFLWSLIYGDLNMVQNKAKALFRVHSRVQGELTQPAGRHRAGNHYQANEVNALLWVHVTAFYSRVKLYQSLIKPLTQRQLDQFCQEAIRYAFCFGIPEEKHPQTWQEVERYVAAVCQSDVLGRTDEGLAIRRFLEATLPWTVRSALWTFLCVSLPEPIQIFLDQPQASPRNNRKAKRVQHLLKVINWLLPDKLANVPAYHEAMLRIKGDTQRDRLLEKLNLQMIGRPSLVR